MSRRSSQSRRAFTLMDVLVSMAVIAILISLMLPAVGSVTETARRVVCQSNIRQIGVGTLMYADSYRGFLPPSVLLSSGPARGAPEPENMILARVPLELQEGNSGWDGLGYLYILDFLGSPPLFYCPSHKGENRFSNHANAWQPEEAGELVINYHYRGQGPNGQARLPNGLLPMTRQLFHIDPSRTSLIADGLRTRGDFNHRVGANYFRADLSVHWYNDSGQRLLGMLPEQKEEATAVTVNQAWELFDQATGGVTVP
ncbi:MAG TPA: DUF1559 domain-containing protein [Phycisphaerales bacterium]|nr:DUF1559 domain-containing protein [Phycisphaerales bacterium]